MATKVYNTRTLEAETLGFGVGLHRKTLSQSGAWNNINKTGQNPAKQKPRQKEKWHLEGNRGITGSQRDNKSIDSFVTKPKNLQERNNFIGKY